MRERPPYQQGKCIPDSVSSSILANLMHANVGKQDQDCSAEYCELYRDWITKTQNNTIVGLNSFTKAAFSQGTTEAFDKFYARHKNRTLKVFAGEYSYHKYATLCTQINNVNNLGPNDSVIVSIPFADSGTEYKYHQLMRECEALGIPVLVDCCWYGTCGEMTFNFSYDCIEEVVFSLSKTFPVSRLRIGIRFSRSAIEDGLDAYVRDSYLNFYSQHIGIGFLSRFSADYMFEKYRQKQLEICKQLEVTPSPVVNLAVGVGEQWDYLNRSGPHNRLCLSDALIQDK